MTPFDLTQCPPPDGMEWIGRVAGLSFEYEARRTSSVWVNLRGDATQDEDPRGWYVTVTAFYLNLSVTTGAFLPDLPSAYRRALQAVGMAADPEKEALTREVEALRQTVRGCETCGGEGMMMVPAGYNEDEVGDLRPEVCSECHGTCVSSWGQAIDEAAALRAEVDALRAQVAAAPEVLREWPKTVEEAPGEWVRVTEGPLSRGVFRRCSLSDQVYFRDSSGRSQFPTLRPGEFFVRVP